MKRAAFILLTVCHLCASDEESTASKELAHSVHSKGWIAFSAQSGQGDWDVYLMRPDGSGRRALTETPDYNEAGARFSPDGKQMLYYRMPKSTPVDNNTYGTFDLVIVKSNGTQPVVLGNTFRWASWSSDSQKLACLSPKGILIVDIATRQIVNTLPRRGLVQQLVWSPDGKSFTGTANGLGAYWNIGVVPRDGSAIHAASETERYNCTPDWHPDSKHVLYSRGIVPEEKSRAQLWMAGSEGNGRQMLYAESARHIYGACSSPDAQFLLFTRSVEDLGAVGKSQTTMALIRWTDTPMLGDDNPELKKVFPTAKPVRRLDLGPGWEPDWTLSELPSMP